MAIRASPHVGFVRAVVTISRCRSTGIGGRPGRDLQPDGGAYGLAKGRSAPLEQHGLVASSRPRSEWLTM